MVKKRGKKVHEKKNACRARTRVLKHKVALTKLFGPAACSFLEKKHLIIHGTYTRNTRHTAPSAPKLGWSCTPILSLRREPRVVASRAVFI